jgi:hypothetical protein
LERLGELRGMEKRQRFATDFTLEERSKIEIVELF